MLVRAGLRSAKLCGLAPALRASFFLAAVAAIALRTGPYGPVLFRIWSRLSGCLYPRLLACGVVSASRNLVFFCCAFAHHFPGGWVVSGAGCLVSRGIFSFPVLDTSGVVVGS